MKKLIDKLREERTLTSEEFAHLLSHYDDEALAYINQQAREVATAHFGQGVYIRGLIEISNYCRNNCNYCGIRKDNWRADRYRLSKEMIWDCCEHGYKLGFRSFVLQGGEDPKRSDNDMEEIIAEIRRRYPECAITLSIGEKPAKAYERYFMKGADRYLLRHETFNRGHYYCLHPYEMSNERRIKCLQELKRIGFQTGTGIMVGTPRQRVEFLIEDIRFIENFQPEMIGIGPFIPHQRTPFCDEKAGSVELTLLLLSIFRLMHPKALIPSTTALASLAPDGRIRGILAGANVVMPNLSPIIVRNKYNLYDQKVAFGAEAAEGLALLEKQLTAVGYHIDYSRGDYNNESTKDMYKVDSPDAIDFINHQEIIETLEYARAHRNDRELIRNLIEKARLCKGLTHREAAILLECAEEDLTKEIFHLAKEIKQKFYGNRIVMFAPLYLSNYCVNGCVYCPYHLKNKTIIRKKLTQEEICREVIALQDMGHKRLALEAGEDPVRNSIDYILESIRTIYSIHHKNGAIRRVNVNIAATTVENYRKLKDAGIGTYILFQETYHKENYEQLHPTGPKSNYAYHTEAMDRAMQGGIDDVGMGVLFGLNTYRYDFVGLLMHAEHLEAVYGVGPHTISVPRICSADDINAEDFENAISDEIFQKIVAVIRISVPYTGMIISTRESQKTREKVLDLGISQISGGSRTSVGGYAEAETPEENSAQFDVSDTRTLDEVVNWLLKLGYIPSFCTACYRAGRTGDRFMSLVKSGQIANCCSPNALITLQEYLEDYASEETKARGVAMIKQEMQHIPNPKIRERALENLKQIAAGERDFRF